MYNNAAPETTGSVRMIFVCRVGKEAEALHPPGKCTKQNYTHSNPTMTFSKLKFSLSRDPRFGEHIRKLTVQCQDPSVLEVNIQWTCQNMQNAVAAKSVIYKVCSNLVSIFIRVTWLFSLGNGMTGLA